MQENGRDIDFSFMAVEPLPMEELACCAVCNDGEWIEGVATDPRCSILGPYRFLRRLRYRRAYIVLRQPAEYNFGVWGDSPVNHIPEGDWYCEKCKAGAKDAVPMLAKLHC